MEEVVQNAAAVLALILQEEEEEENIMMAIAEVAVNEIMEMEDGEGLVDYAVWVKINVNINEYHAMGDPCFKLHFRMSRAVFESLTETIFNHLVAKGRLKRQRTPIQNVVLMVVWLLATPDTFRSVSLRFGVRPSTLYYFYTYIIEALREMAHLYISWPGPEERHTIKTAFATATGFPGIVGCIDGTHVNITAPLEHAAQYINRHHTYSINVQAVVDNNLLVRELHVGEVGSMHDRRVFRRSPIHDQMLQGEGDLLSADEHLVGDGAYAIADFMMVPFRNNGHLTDLQKNFNKRLSQCRVRVENAFARAKGKWRRLKFLHARNPLNVVDHITASFVLHNFLILNGEAMIDEEELRRPIPNNRVLGNEPIVDDEDDENNEEYQELLDAAEERGEEKRLLIMNSPDLHH